MVLDKLPGGSASFLRVESRRDLAGGRTFQGCEADLAAAMLRDAGILTENCSRRSSPSRRNIETHPESARLKLYRSARSCA